MSTTVFVDLIEEKPLSREAYFRRHPTGDHYRYLDHFQPWRWVAKNAGNQKKLARSSERYFNAIDARTAIYQLFGPNVNVFLRQAEMGNVSLRAAQ